MNIPSFDSLLKNPQNLNPYLYALANPTTHTDPSGLVCGSKWSEWFVPDRFSTYDFTDCCQDHDDCYGCKGKNQKTSKQVCDQNFCDCMLRQCETLDDDPSSGYSKTSCKQNARTYCSAVQGKYGNAAFTEARKKCCQ